MDIGFNPKQEGFVPEGLVWRDGRPAGALNVNRQGVALFREARGGLTRGMLELAPRYRDFEGLPKVALENVRDFFPKAVEDARDLPVRAGPAPGVRLRPAGAPGTEVTVNDAGRLTLDVTPFQIVTLLFSLHADLPLARRGGFA